MWGLAKIHSCLKETAEVFKVHFSTQREGENKSKRRMFHGSLFNLKVWRTRQGDAQKWDFALADWDKRQEKRGLCAKVKMDHGCDYKWYLQGNTCVAGGML